MSSLEDLNRKIDALEQKIGANEAKVDAGTLSEVAERVAIRQQISTDTALLTSLIGRRERLEQQQQQQQAGE